MRSMRRLAMGTAGAAAVAMATVAFAQTHGKPARGGPKPKPAASAGSDAPADDKAPTPANSSAAMPASGPTAPLADAGPVAAPTNDTNDGGRLSPLNPAANEFSDASAPRSSIDYDHLLADIGALRARVAAVSDTLFHSRIAISLEASGEHGRVTALSVSLDDGVVWTSPPAFRAEDATTVYDHAVAPGHHAVGVDIERRDDRNETFRSAQHSRFVVEVPADERLSVELKLWDESGMGSDFSRDRSGQYELRVRARAKAQPLSR